MTIVVVFIMTITIAFDNITHVLGITVGEILFTSETMNVLAICIFFLPLTRIMSGLFLLLLPILFHFYLWCQKAPILKGE